jgi:hypothetical protein
MQVAWLRQLKKKTNIEEKCQLAYINSRLWTPNLPSPDVQQAVARTCPCVSRRATNFPSSDVDPLEPPSSDLRRRKHAMYWRRVEAAFARAMHSGGRQCRDREGSRRAAAAD